MESKTMNKATVILAILAVLALIAVLMPKQAEAQDVIPAAVQTRVAEVKEKAQALGANSDAVDEAADGVAAFRATAQAALSTQLDPRLQQPTRIPRGRGQRVYHCLQQRYDRNSRTWICVRTGR